MVHSCIDSLSPLLHRPIDIAALLRIQSTQSRQKLDLGKSKFETFRNVIQSKRKYHHRNQKNKPVRIRLSTFFYDNFDIFNSRIKTDKLILSNGKDSN